MDKNIFGVYLAKEGVPNNEAYHATRPQFASNDEKWRKLLEHLGGKELTSAGHLSAQNFSFSDEVMMENLSLIHI